MTYTEKKQASKNVLEAIYGLKDQEEIKVIYGTGYRGKPNQYFIKAYWSEHSKEYSYSIWNNYSGMNIDSLGPTMAKAYTYDMMSQRTNYNFPLYEMALVEDNPLEKLPGYIGTEKGELV